LKTLKNNNVSLPQEISKIKILTQLIFYSMWYDLSWIQLCVGVAWEDKKHSNKKNANLKGLWWGIVPWNYHPKGQPLMEPKETSSAQIKCIGSLEFLLKILATTNGHKYPKTCCQISQTSFDCVKLFNQFHQETHDIISISNKLFSKH